MKTEKVYCVNCRYYDIMECFNGELCRRCIKIIGTKEIPINMVPVYASIEDDNANNDCKYCTHKPAERPKTKWWHRLFRIDSRRQKRDYTY